MTTENNEYAKDEFWGLALSDDVAITPMRRILARRPSDDDGLAGPWEDVGYLKDGVSVQEALDQALEAYGK